MFAIYRAAESPSAWKDCLDRIRGALDGTGISLMHHDAEFQQRSVVAHEGFDEQSFVRYRDYYHQVDPWGQALRHIDLSAGRVVEGCEIVAPADVRRSEYYADFGRYIGSAQSLFGAIETDEKRTALIIVLRGPAGVREPRAAGG